MEGDPQTQAAILAPTEAPSASPDSATSDEPIGYSRGSFEDVFSKAFSWTDQPTAPEPAVSSGEPAAETDDEDADETTGEEPAAQPAAASVTPEAQPGEETPPKPLSRREQERQAKEARIAELEAENTRLAAEREAKIARARDEARASYEADQQRQQNGAAQQAAAAQSAAELQRFEDACRMADTDPRLTELVPGDPEGRNLYQWREDRKDLIARYPEAERHIRADAARFVDSKLAELGQQQNAFWIDVRSQMADTASGLGIDIASWDKQGTTWKDIATGIEQAATARATERVTADLTGKVQAAEAEALKLRKENQDLQDRLLGLTKAPSLAGRSQTATDEKATGANYRGTWQENLAAAFG